MKKRGLLLALLGALVLVLLMAVQAASGAPDESSEQCRYFYQLLPQGESKTTYDLYVERTRLDGPSLHTGSISLITLGDMSFLPASGVSTQPLDGKNIHDILDGRGYVSFFWYWDPQTALPDTSAGSQGVEARRQKLGTVTFTNTALDLSQVELIPWVQLPAGQAQLQAWRDAQTAPDGDPEAQFKLLRAIWRMEDPAQPERGYYQGYYPLEDPEETPSSGETEAPVSTPGTGTADEETSAQRWVDITAGWQGFVLGTYDPEEPISLTFYKAAADGSYGTGAADVYGVCSITPGTGTGYARTRIHFSALKPQNLSGAELADGFVDGTYKMVVKKESHVDATFTGLTVADGNVFPELLGMTVILPCGDVDGDNHVSQEDRALLTAPDGFYQNTSKGDTDGTKTLYDLDGDGNVTETDLAILIAPANYGRQALKFNFH